MKILYGVAIFAICFIIFTGFALFGYDKARSDIAEACIEHGAFKFQGSRYDCELHTVP